MVERINSRLNDTEKLVIREITDAELKKEKGMKTSKNNSCWITSSVTDIHITWSLRD